MRLDSSLFSLLTTHPKLQGKRTVWFKLWASFFEALLTKYSSQMCRGLACRRRQDLALLRTNLLMTNYLEAILERRIAVTPRWKQKQRVGYCTSWFLSHGSVVLAIIPPLQAITTESTKHVNCSANIAWWSVDVRMAFLLSRQSCTPNSWGDLSIDTGFRFVLFSFSFMRDKNNATFQSKGNQNKRWSLYASIPKKDKNEKLELFVYI